MLFFIVRCTFLETKGKKVGADKLLDMCTWLIWEITLLYRDWRFKEGGEGLEW